MSTKVLMDVEEYLHTSFEPDCEYLDGGIVERNMGEIAHADVQIILASWLRRLRHTLGIRALTEIRIQINPRRYRVADIAVWRNDDIGRTGIPKLPPYLVIEILSPDDRMVRFQPKIQEYLSIGVEWVWVVDPQEKAALCFSRPQPQGFVCTVLHSENPNIGIPLDKAFDLDA